MHNKILGSLRTKSRLLPLLLVALAANGVLLRTAHAQFVTTLDPIFFAPGTNISNALPGVTLSAMSLVPDGTNGQGVPLYGPSYAPVYADGDFFSPQSSPSTSSAASWGGGFFNLASFADSCFQTCFPNVGQNFGTALLISFNKPVDMVDALQIDNPQDGAFIQAFDSSHQLVGYCLPAFGPQAIGNYGCYSVLGNTCGDTVSCPLLTSISAPQISEVLVGGYNMADEIRGIQFAAAAPEIDTASAASGLTLLLGGLLVLRGRRVTLRKI
jgi:hypothetical protein